jgi:hypothetical protein
LFDFSGLPGGARYGGGHQGYFDDIVYNGSPRINPHFVFYIASKAI